MAIHFQRPTTTITDLLLQLRYDEETVLNSQRSELPNYLQNGIRNAPFSLHGHTQKQIGLPS